MTTTKRHYESLYIIDTTLSEEQVDSTIAKYSDLITANDGEVIAAGRWDKRRLAYDIKGRREGIYILMYFIGEAAVEKELDRVMRIADDVFRHIIVRVEPEHIDTSRIIKAAPAQAAPVEPKPEAAPAEETPAEAPAQEAVEAPAEEPAAEASSENVAEESQAAPAE